MHGHHAAPALAHIQMQGAWGPAGPGGRPPRHKHLVMHPTALALSTVHYDMYIPNPCPALCSCNHANTPHPAMLDCRCVRCVVPPVRPVQPAGWPGSTAGTPFCVSWACLRLPPSPARRRRSSSRYRGQRGCVGHGDGGCHGQGAVASDYIQMLQALGNLWVRIPM